METTTAVIENVNQTICLLPGSRVELFARLAHNQQQTVHQVYVAPHTIPLLGIHMQLLDEQGRCETRLKELQ